MFYGAWLSTLSILFQWATGGVCVQCSVQNVGKCDIVSLQFVTRKRYKGKHLLRWKVGCTAAPLVAFQKLLTPPIWKPSMADWQRRIFIKAYSPQFMESCSCKQSCLVLETSPTTIIVTIWKNERGHGMFSHEWRQVLKGFLCGQTGAQKSKWTRQLTTCI